METKQHVRHPSAVRLFNQIIGDTPPSKTGTYNKQDPTHYEIGETDFMHQGIRFRFAYHDCTWGVEVTISKVARAAKTKFLEKTEIIAGFYITREEEYINNKRVGYEAIILRQAGFKGVLKLLAIAFRPCLHPLFKSAAELEQEYRMGEEYVEDPMGCLSDYE